MRSLKAFVTIVTSIAVGVFLGYHFIGRSDNGSTVVSLPGSGYELEVPTDGLPIVLALTREGGNGCVLCDNGYLIDAIRESGMGLVQATYSAADLPTIARETLAAIAQTSDYKDAAVGLLVEGHSASQSWSLLTDPPANLRSAVLIDVPGVQDLNFDDSRTVAVLSLNLLDDAVVNNSHHHVHEGMAQSEVAHQVVTYDSLGADSLDPNSEEFDQATAEDVEERAIEWLMVRDGVSNLAPAESDK